MAFLGIITLKPLMAFLGGIITLKPLMDFLGGIITLKNPNGIP